MEKIGLNHLIDALEQGTKIHINVEFFNNYGNQLTNRTHGQMVHNSPACMFVKKTPRGLAECYRCKRIVVRMARHYKRSFYGCCPNGIIEYCRPIIFEDQFVGMIFIGNILTDDPKQKERLMQNVDSELLETMEQNYSIEDCVRTADIVERYITFLFERYGNDNINYDPLLENIKSYIRENMAYDISLSELANIFNYNEKYLGQLFKARAGCTVKEYCNIIRVDRAKHLLAQTKQSIANIAQQLGYSNVTYFDRVFHRITGVSPREYRSHRKQSENG